MNIKPDNKETTVLLETITKRLDSLRSSKALSNAAYETGLTGVALYYAYLAKSTGDKSVMAKAEETFEEGIEALDLKTFKPVYESDTIDAHLSQLGRIIIFGNRYKLFDIGADEYLSELDGILFDLMKSKISVRDFDCGCGAIASGHYFLSRLKSGHDTSDKLKILVHGINNFAKKDSEGNYYWESPSFYNRVYIGISHGSSMIISFLANLCDKGIEAELCLDIIEKASNFIMKQYRKSEFKGLFPNKIGDPVEPMQFALCYGDIGVGYALFRAGQVLQSERVSSFASMILEDCLTRKTEDNLTLDAGIFYGATGLAIAFTKTAEVTQDKRFEEMANYWFQAINSYAIHDNDFAGFQSRLSESDILWNASFGWGIAGIGLGLLLQTDNKLPHLDELTFFA